MDMRIIDEKCYLINKEYSRFILFTLLCIIVALCLLLISNSAEGKVITVDDSSPADYSSIQDAINASTNNDTILVESGRYYYPLTVNKSISLIGNQTTMLLSDTVDSDFIISIIAENVTIDGFHLIGTLTTLMTGIDIKSENVTILNSSLENFIEAGISISNSNNISIQNNQLFNGGWGILIDSSPNITIINNHFYYLDRGITSRNNREIAIIRNQFYYNKIGIRFSGSNNLVNISTNIFVQNTCGIRFTTLPPQSNKNTTDIHIKNNTLFSNDYGVQVIGNVSDLQIHDNNIYDSIIYGVDASNNGIFHVNATMNNWGNFTGPYHPTMNPNGTGDSITENVIFSPWITSNNNGISIPKASILSITPNPAIEMTNITLKGQVIDDELITAYRWVSSLDGEIYYGKATTTRAILSPGYHEITFSAINNDGIWSNEAKGSVKVNPLVIANTPPSVQILYPGNGSVIMGITHIRGLVDDLEEEDDIVTFVSVANSEWINISERRTWIYKLNTTLYENGTIYVRFKAFDGVNYSEVKSLKFIIDNRNLDSSDDTIPVVYPIGIIVIGLAVIFFIFEPIKFLMISLFSYPLYSKIRRNRVLDLTNRKEIFQYISRKPGSNLTRLHRSLPMGYGTLVYHLMVLEREKYIKSRMILKRKMFFPNDKRTWNQIAKPNDTFASDSNISSIPVRSKILNFIREHGSVSQNDIIEGLEIRQSTVSYNLQILVREGKIVTYDDVKRKTYSAIKDN